MMYLAPRQGRFAIVLLCSFCVLFFCFVWNTEYSAKRVRQEALTAALIRFSDEARLPLSLGDKVGLAVVAERYYDENAVKNLSVHDPNGAVLLMLGTSSQQPAIQVPVVDGERVLGEVLLVPKAVSRAQIIQAYWPFLLALLLGHIMLWLIYGYIARPTLKMQEDLKKQLEQGKSFANPIQGTEQNTSEQTTTNKAATQNNEASKTTDQPTKAKVLEPSLSAFVSNTKPSKTQRLAVVMGFADKHGLFDMLSEDSALQYLRLCDEILKKTLMKLVQTPDFVGVGVVQVDTFAAKGAKVLLAKTQSEAKLVLAGATMAKLILMVFDEIYEQQRKHGVFALQMRVFLCDDTDSKAAQKALLTQKSDMALGLDEPMLAQITDWVSTKPAEAFASYKSCHEVMGVNAVLLKKLEGLRFAILTEEDTQNS